jgi:hypothetical protein
MTDPEAAFWRIVAANYTRDEVLRLRMVAKGWVSTIGRDYGYGYRRF